MQFKKSINYLLFIFIFSLNGCRNDCKDAILVNIDGWKKIDENWYFYEKGKLIKDKVVEIDGILYFFCPDGRMLNDNTDELKGNVYRAKLGGALYQHEWYKTLDENWYFYDINGIMVKNAWNGEYYLLEDGKMATNQYIDRFYIDSDGKWKTNNYTEDYWLVDGTWIKYDEKYCYLTPSGKKQLIDLAEIRSINRLGYNTVDKNGFPQQSIIAYKEALNHGFSIVLCDLRFTLDNIPVCFHDYYINKIARNQDGSVIEQEISITESTYEYLNTYDNGIYKGSNYKNTKLLTLQQMLDFCEKKWS